MIRVEDLGRIRVVAMEHGKANALDVELLGALEAAIGEAERASAALVLTGMGSIFSAGVDLFRLVEEGPTYIDHFLPSLEACFSRLFTFSKPAVAAINGHAIAGGCILACACDRRLAAIGRGRIGVPELLVGVPFPGLALEIVRAATSDGVATDLAITGATHPMDEALRRGLIDAMVEPEILLDRACEVAEELASIPAAAFALVKRQLRQPAIDRCKQLASTHDPAVARVWRDASTRETIRAYLQRTIPKK